MVYPIEFKKKATMGWEKSFLQLAIECQESNQFLYLITVRDKCLKPSVPLIGK